MRAASAAMDSPSACVSSAGEAATAVGAHPGARYHDDPNGEESHANEQDNRLGGKPARARHRIARTRRREWRCRPARDVHVVNGFEILKRLLRSRHEISARILATVMALFTQ